MNRTQVNQFRISGPIDDLKTLTTSIECVLSLTWPIESITGFRVDTTGRLVFCTDSSKKQTRYPFPPSVNVLAEHIINYISGISEDDLHKFGEEVTGYEEEYAIGYELYSNDYATDNHTIDDNTFSDVFAVKPIKLEWGK